MTPYDKKVVITNLGGVKVGDKFVLEVGWNNTRFFIVVCDEVTNKQAIIGGKKYRKNDARCLCGSESQYSYRLYAYNADIQAEMDYERIYNKTWSICSDKSQFSKLPKEKIEAIYEILK